MNKKSLRRKLGKGAHITGGIMIISGQVNRKGPLPPIVRDVVCHLSNLVGGISLWVGDKLTYSGASEPQPSLGTYIRDIYCLPPVVEFVGYKRDERILRIDLEPLRSYSWREKQENKRLSSGGCQND